MSLTNQQKDQRVIRATVHSSGGLIGSKSRALKQDRGGSTEIARGMATLTCRRVILLTTTTPHHPPLLLSSVGASSSRDCSASSASQQHSPSSSSCAPMIALPNDQRQGRISWRRVTPHSRHLALLCQGPLTKANTAVAEAQVGAARQLWRSHSKALNSTRWFSSGFSQPAPHIKSERFDVMATGGSSQSGGFATSSILKEKMHAKGAENRTGYNQKLITFETNDGHAAVGVARGDSFWSLQDVLKSSDGKPLPNVRDMASVINNWSDLKDRLIVEGSGTKLSEVKLLAPIPRPTGVIMCIGKNYLDHVKEVDTWKTHPGITKPEAPKHPIVFTKAPQSVVGPGAAIKYPHGVSSAVDYEAELGVIIGKAGNNIKTEDAMSHIFGYTIINDVTARDLQKRHQQWFIGKSCDTFCPMGPGIVPASEIDGNDLQIQCWINDELRQDGRTSQMIFGIPQLIEVISAAITLQPGDIIATGTPAGVGSGFNPPRHLAPGDRIRIYVEGIGELCNTVE